MGHDPYFCGYQKKDMGDDLRTLIGTFDTIARYLRKRTKKTFGPEHHEKANKVQESKGENKAQEAKEETKVREEVKR